MRTPEPRDASLVAFAVALLTLATPDHVRTVTGNPVASAIRNVLAL